MEARWSLAFLAVGVAGLGSCAAPSGPTEVVVPAGQYSEVFQRAKDVLRELEFELDRIDARAGVISTAPRSWSGAATPWIPHASLGSDPIDGLAHFERRMARIEFVPASGGEGDVNVANTGGDLTARVHVSVERVYRPLRRADPTSIKLSSQAIDPPLLESGIQPTFSSEYRADEALAAKIAQRLLSEPGS